MLVTIAEKNIGILCMQELFFGGGWITWSIVSDVFIISKGKKSINAEIKEWKCRINSHIVIVCVLCE